MNFTIPFSAIGENEVGLVGGKALSLGLLAQAGFNVPKGFVITTDAYRALQGKGASAELEEAVLNAYDALGAERVAVRSSAIAEDSAEASWAGQFESYLNVGRAQLVDSVEKCWRSASSETVKAYAESASASREQLAVAVVVQKMVESEVSGVAFSVNPVTKSDDEIMIEAIYGLGELLVQGMTTPDNYVIDKSSLKVREKHVQIKPSMLRFENGRNAELPVPEGRRDESCLTDEQIIQLSEMIVKIEQFYGKPQDVEWALGNNRFYVVQSRPITTI